MMMSCPSCSGERVVDEPLVLNSYSHEPTCSLLLDEQQTLDTDRRRHDRRGAVIRHRAATPAERALVAASGVRIGSREPMFVRIDWPAADLRLRLFARAGLVSVTELSS